MFKENRVIFATAAGLAKKAASQAAAKARREAMAAGKSKEEVMGVGNAAVGATMTLESLKKPPVNQTPTKPASASSTSQWNGTSWAEPDNAMSTPVPSISSSSNPTGGAKADSAGNYSYTLNGQTVSVTPDEVTKYGSIAKAGKSKLTSDTIFDEQKDPANIDEALVEKVETGDVVEEEGKTYAEQAEEEWKGGYKDLYDLGQKYGFNIPFKTFEEYKKWRDTANQEDIDHLNEQQNIARELEASGAQKATEQMKGAEAATTSAMAQSREGVMTTSAPAFAQEFSQQMDRQRNQIALERKSAELSRQRAMTELKRAQDAGEIELAEAIQGQLSSIERSIRAQDAEALKLATLANEQALEYARFAETKTTNMVNTFEAMGAGLADVTIENLQQMIAGTNITLPQALAFKEMAKLQKEADATKNEVEKEYKLAQIANLKAELSTIGKPDSALEWEYYKNLSTSEKKEYDALKSQGNVQLVEGEDGKYYSYNKDTNKMTLVADPTQWKEYDQEVFKIGQAVGWCGDYSSTLSTATTVGNYWSDKREAIDDKNITVGDKLLIPLGVSNAATDYGHVATVLNYDPLTGEIEVAESNRDGRQVSNEGTQGIATFGTYNVNDLNAKYKDDWGVAHGDLKEPYASAIPEIGGYTDEQKAVMNALDPENLTGTDLDVLKENKLDSGDLALYFSENRKKLSPEDTEEVQNALDSLLSLKTMGGLEGAVGFGFQKWLAPDFMTGEETGFIEGSDAATFAKEFMTFRDSMVMPLLDKLKGAMSDKDILLLKNSATSLSLEQNEKQFKKTLQALEDKYTQLITQGTDISVEDSDPAKVLPESNIKNDPLGLYQTQ